MNFAHNVRVAFSAGVGMKLSLPYSLLPTPYFQKRLIANPSELIRSKP